MNKHGPKLRPKLEKGCFYYCVELRSRSNLGHTLGPTLFSTLGPSWVQPCSRHYRFYQHIHRMYYIFQICLTIFPSYMWVCLHFVFVVIAFIAIRTSLSHCLWLCGHWAAVPKKLCKYFLEKTCTFGSWPWDQATISCDIYYPVSRNLSVELFARLCLCHAAMVRNERRYQSEAEKTHKLNLFIFVFAVLESGSKLSDFLDFSGFGSVWAISVMRNDEEMGHDIFQTFTWPTRWNQK